MANREDALVLNFANNVSSICLAIADEGMNVHENMNGVSAGTTGAKIVLKGPGIAQLEGAIAGLEIQKLR
jgi:hypothetical protein